MTAQWMNGTGLTVGRGAISRPSTRWEGEMALFLSTVTNKVDKKGRVSVPAAFRNAVAKTGFSGVVVHPHLRQPCLQGSDIGYMERLSDTIDSGFGPYNDDRETVAMTILGGSRELAFDPEGRILLPADLLEHGAITTHATFVGLGKTFHIWQPEAFDQELARRQQAAAQGADLIQPVGGRRGDG